MIYNMYDLENAINCGTFAPNTYVPQIDPQMLLDTIKVLMASIKMNETDNMTLRNDVVNLQTQLSTISSDYREVLDVMRKIGKDYPEIVLAKPHLFTEGETNELHAGF